MSEKLCFQDYGDQEKLTSLIHLETLSNFKLNKLKEDYRNLRNEWVKKQKCSCVLKLRKEDILDCKHIKKELKRKFEEEDKKVWNLTLLTSLKNLSNRPNLCYNFFKNFKL